MNLLLLEAGEAGSLLPRNDRRHEHLRKVLKKKVGDEVEAGMVTALPFAPAPGSLGKARIEKLDEEGLILGYRAETEAPPLARLRLVLGFPRPIQAGRILKDLTSLGLADLELCGTALGEKSYLESTFFKDGEYRRPLLEGAEQAGNPRLPRVALHWTLARCLAALDDPEWDGGLFFALHPSPESPNLGAALAGLGPGAKTRPVTLAIGSERGWTGEEVALLSSRGFALCGLGDRILKTETAATVASALVLSAQGRL